MRILMSLPTAAILTLLTLPSLAHADNKIQVRGDYQKPNNGVNVSSRKDKGAYLQAVTDDKCASQNLNSVLDLANDESAQKTILGIQQSLNTLDPKLDISVKIDYSFTTSTNGSGETIYFFSLVWNLIDNKTGEVPKGFEDLSAGKFDSHAIPGSDNCSITTDTFPGLKDFPGALETTLKKLLEDVKIKENILKRADQLSKLNTPVRTAPDSGAVADQKTEARTTDSSALKDPSANINAQAQSAD